LLGALDGGEHQIVSARITIAPDVMHFARIQALKDLSLCGDF
jgi:hypothetical protein